MARSLSLVVPTGLLVAALGVSTLTVQAVGALADGRGPSVSSDGPDAPAWVSVPAAGVDQEPVTPEGLTAQGTVDPDQGEAIWYSGSGRVVPGQVGTAVVAAHMIYYDEPDVFYDLGEVEEGDVVTVGYNNGTTRDFVVTDTQQISKEGLQTAPQVWGDQDDVARIALITCDDSLGERPDGQRKANFVAIAEAVGPVEG
ncbi:class F sortase [Ornithinimicrobium cerasi]|uniref:LPXTG-site transpeptidase (Sortase) family protein n=1 Tax=Ornithinimicrobium cerasi TaxID=2248773 RepID=A0A285VRB8_9MICO|nr:class F sortase [Ornithinimicrobium cerasi]SOC56595.1 LPXTG-site transpeptidase (sortase) family protein [Ornithinimicrobium cerasi]